MRATTATVAAAVALSVAACGSSGSSASPPPTVAKTTTTAAPETKSKKPRRTGRTVAVHGSAYGRILADGKGRALYLFTRERRGGKARCYGGCASAWPPFLTKGLPRAGAKVDERKLGVVRRSDGRRQVTYNGHPLYHYVSDRAPGQVTCQDVTEYGGTWLVVDRAGNAVR